LEQSQDNSITKQDNSITKSEPRRLCWRILRAIRRAQLGANEHIDTVQVE